MCEVVDSDFNADLSWGSARDCITDLGGSDTCDCITDLCEGCDRITGFAAGKVGSTCNVVDSSDAGDVDSDAGSADVDSSDAGGVDADSDAGSADVSWFIELIFVIHPFISL